jgi:hypothetical protein
MRNHVNPAATQRGFALITALLLLVVVSALGFGSLFMSQSSLQVIENAHTKAIARSNAEAGLDAAMLVIGKAAAGGAFPSPSSLAAEPITVLTPSGSTAVTISRFTIDAADASRARLAVTATGPRGARHTAEALLGAGGGVAPRVDPMFYRGLVATGVVKNSGGIAPIIAAEIHGDRGYSLEADFRNCTIRDTTTGLCTSSELIAENFPLTAANGMASYSCKVKSNVGIVDPCFGGTPMNRVAPIALTAPPYAQIRNSAMFNGRPIGDYLANSSLCTHTTVPLVPPENSVICATGEVDLSSRPISGNVLILTSGKIKSGGGSNLRGVTLVTTGNEITMSGGNALDDVRFFAQTKLTLSGGSTVVGGSSTLASAGSVTMSGGTSALTPYVEGGKTAVGIAIIGGGGITLSGGSVFYGTIWGGSGVTLSGGTNIFGGIATVGDITLTGGAFVDSNVNVMNADLPQVVGSGLQVLSRR